MIWDGDGAKQPTCAGVDAGRAVEVTQRAGVVCGVAVCVCVLRTQLGGQQLGVCHQGG